jgi:hypothetical protein
MFSEKEANEKLNRTCDNLKARAFSGSFEFDE